MAEFKIIKQCGKARLGEFTTVHGTVKTPAFQNVATCGAIKGALDAYDLKDVRAQVQLCNGNGELVPGDKVDPGFFFRLSMNFNNLSKLRDKEEIENGNDGANSFWQRLRKLFRK